MKNQIQNEIKTVTEMFIGRNYVYTMSFEVHQLLMNVYVQMCNIGQKPSFVGIIRNMPNELQREIKVEEVRLNGIRAGRHELIKLIDVPYE